MLAMVNSKFVRSLYRSVLRSVKTIEENPAVKTLLYIHDEQSILPDPAKSLLDSYRGTGWYVPGVQPKYSLKDRAIQGCQLMRRKSSVDDGLTVLRYLNGIVDQGSELNLLNHQFSDALENLEKPAVEVTDELKTGVVLLAHPLMQGWFQRSVVVLVDHTDKHTSSGLILNRPLTLTIESLKEAMDNALKEGSDDDPKFVDVEGWGRLKLQKQKVQQPVVVEDTEAFNERMKDAFAEAQSFVESMLEREARGEELDKRDAAALSMARGLLEQHFSNLEYDGGVSNPDEQGSSASPPSETSQSGTGSDMGEAEDVGSPSIREEAPSNSRVESEATSPSHQDRLHNGGPVLAMSVLHSPGDLQGGKRVLGNVHFSECAQLLWGMMNLTGPNVRYFLGLSTWTEGQLEEEVSKGYWIRCKAPVEVLDLLDGGYWEGKEAGGKIGSLWYRLMVGLGKDYAALSQLPVNLPIYEE
ncbi:hypothetical protein BSKO_01431 [Bryopsis sp. KO-2023]|nr:hypothetical protein BSKO_01431 [Bryopsis sp. KO-2023]